MPQWIKGPNGKFAGSKGGNPGGGGGGAGSAKVIKSGARLNRARKHLEKRQAEAIKAARAKGASGG